jgi:hypothetical protein
VSAALALEEKAKLLELYAERTQLLIDWEQNLRKRLGKEKLPTSLVLSESIITSKNLNLSTEDDFKRFDFVQNQVSQAISLYLASEAARSVKPSNLEKIEEGINRTRLTYHVLAFEAINLNRQFRFNETPPLVFAAEQMLLDRGLFLKK